MKYTFDDSINEKGKQNHIHLLDLEDGKGFQPLTGTSSVGDVLSKPLSWWASGKAVGDLGWIHPDIKKNGRTISKVPLEDRLAVSNLVLEAIKNESPEQFLARLDKAYKAHKTSLDDSAEKGTDLHAELEKFVKSEMGIWKGLTEFHPRIEPFIVWTKNNVKKFIWSEAYCFDEDLWVGGISDVGAELNDGRLAVIDFKSSKEAYETHFIQAGGYAIQIEKNGLWNKDGTINKKVEGKFSVFISIPFGAPVVEPVIKYEVEKYKKGFELALGLYKILDLGKKKMN